MTIFYNCTNPPSDIVSPEIRCLEKYFNNSIKHSYGFRPDLVPNGYDWHHNCEKSVSTYYQSDPVTYDGSSPYYPSDPYPADMVKTLQQGFWLNLQQPINCTDCESSGGRCSSNETKGAITCFCPHGITMVDVVCPRNDYYGYGGPSARKRVIIGISASVGSIIFVSILLYVIIIYRNTIRSLCNGSWLFLLAVYGKRIRPCYTLAVSYWRKKTKNQTNVEMFFEKNLRHLALQSFTYYDVMKMTNSFQEPLGHGGYGSVFKGTLRDGQLVAVKVLSEAKGKGEDFINEVASIATTNHVNVVSLLGFCTEDKKRALVYEYMPNGSLERFIFTDKNSSTTSPLGREKLYEITLGIARGLDYLHRGCKTRILHLDIKPHNILLDHEFCPRISDFGLAKLCPTRETLVSLVGARGTVGYIAPEIYCRNFGGVSHKSDVYSYGMMVLEMIGGRKNIDATVENLSEIYFPNWIYARLERDSIENGTENNNAHAFAELFKEGTLKKMIIVSLWCIQPHPGDRPPMYKVVDMLEGNVDELALPPNPFPDPSSTSSAT